MTLTVTGRHVVVTPATRSLISKKLAPLTRVLNDSVVSTQCVIARERQMAVCELTLHARGDHVMHAVGRHARLPGAVAAAVDKISQQAHRLSDRWKTRRRTAVAGKAVLEPDGAPTPVAESPRIIPSRGYAIRPMTVEDAALLLGSRKDTCLVFRQTATDTLAVLYRRPDGHLGLIEPES